MDQIRSARPDLFLELQGTLAFGCKGRCNRTAFPFRRQASGSDETIVVQLWTAQAASTKSWPGRRRSRSATVLRTHMLWAKLVPPALFSFQFCSGILRYVHPL